jgi:Domain of unknown function (DUF4253)
MPLKNLFAKFFPRKSQTQSLSLLGYLYPEGEHSCPVYEIDGKNAYELIQKFNIENPSLFLVALGSSTHRSSILEHVEGRAQTPEEVILGDFEEFLEAQKQTRKLELGIDAAFPRGEWDDDVDRVTPYYGSLYDWTKDGPVAHEKVQVVAVPSTPEWAVLKYIPFGAWNDCPYDEIHVAAHKKWFEQYGARIEGVTSDILTFNVVNPPSNREDALKLAEEQFLYCPDIVEQGTQTIDALAASLLNNKTWFFWWD